MQDTINQNNYVVERVVNVFHDVNLVWTREKPSPRQYDAAIIFLDGAIEYYFTDRDVTVRRGDILLLPENVPYAGKRLTDVVEFICVDFVSENGYTLPDSGFSTVIHANDFEWFRGCFTEMLDTYEKQRADAPLYMKSLLYNIFAAILRNDYPLGVKNKTEEILDFIKQNISDSRLDLGMLCSKFSLSESQIRRNIKKVTGLSPNEYIKSIRINKAQNELICTQDRINEISERCGFESPYYFSKCFADRCGVSPTIFRREHSLI